MKIDNLLRTPRRRPAVAATGAEAWRVARRVPLNIDEVIFRFRADSRAQVNENVTHVV